MGEPCVTVLRDIEREPHTFAPYVMASWCGKAATELERLSAEGREKDSLLVWIRAEIVRSECMCDDRPIGCIQPCSRCSLIELVEARVSGTPDQL